MAPKATWWLVRTRPSGETNAPVPPPRLTTALMSPVPSFLKRLSGFICRPSFIRSRSFIWCGIHMPSSAWMTRTRPKARLTVKKRRNNLIFRLLQDVDREDLLCRLCPAKSTRHPVYRHLLFCDDYDEQLGNVRAPPQVQPSRNAFLGVAEFRKGSGEGPRKKRMFPRAT